MEYATQMDAARKGIVTKEMEIVAKKENIDVESLRLMLILELQETAWILIWSLTRLITL